MNSDLVDLGMFCCFSGKSSSVFPTFKKDEGLDVLVIPWFSQFPGNSLPCPIHTERCPAGSGTSQVLQDNPECFHLGMGRGTMGWRQQQPPAISKSYSQLWDGISCHWCPSWNLLVLLRRVSGSVLAAVQRFQPAFATGSMNFSFSMPSPGGGK